MKIAARVFLIAVLVGLLGLPVLLPVEARADAFTYSTSRRVFKVGCLMLDSTTINAAGPENTAPYLFYIADARTDLKPLGWELVNPRAPKTVTAGVKARWDVRDPSSPYSVGQNVTKNMAAYWEVFLSQASVEDLLQYDLLFIANHRDTKFTPEEREKLRKLVDAGGVLWIEDSAGMRIRTDGPLFVDLQFRTGSAANAGPVVNSPNHPVLNSPYKLTFNEIANLGDKNYGGQYLSASTPAELANPTAGINRGTQYNVPPSPAVLQNIVGNRAANGLPYLAAGIYGSGALIASAADIGDDINNYAGGTVRGNRGAISGPNIQTAHSEDLKFAYNLIAWGSANNTDRRNARRTGASFDTVGAPLLNRFDFTNPGTPADSIVTSQAAPLLVKGVLFVAGLTGGNATLRAYDAQPARDSDRDGNTDDGLPDLILGAPYDEIWRTDLGGGGQPSTPTYAYTFPAGELIFVTLANGGLAAFPAFPVGSNGILTPTNAPLYTNAPSGGGTYAGVTPSPIVYEGRAYVVEPTGLVRCVDAATGATLWSSFDGTAGAPTLTPLGPPTVGFARLQGIVGVGSNSGGNTMDLMLYYPASETVGSGTVGRVLPYWLGTRNEVLVSPSDAANGIFSTRVALSGQKYYVDGTGGRVARVFANEGGFTARENFEQGRQAGWNGGTAYTATYLETAPGSGVLDGRVQVSPTPNPAAGVIVAVDYNIMYIGASGRPPGLNGDGSRDFPARSLRTNGTLEPGSMTGLALSPNDLLVYSARESDTGGALTSVYALNEQFGTGVSKLRWRFTVHPGYANASVGGNSVTDLPVLTNLLAFSNTWPRNTEALSLPSPEALTNVQPVGAPIVTNNGTSYVLARANSSANGVVTVLMAFQTNQETVLNVGPMDRGRPPVISQLNPLTGDTTTLQPNQYVVDFANGKVTISNFQNATGGNGISSSQSFVVAATLAGQTTPTVQIHSPLNSAFGDDFTPLLWYYVLPGTPLSSPSLVGEYIYFTSDRGISRTTGAPTSMIVALDADPAVSDPTVKRAQQVTGVVSTINPGPNAIVVNPNHARWTQSLEPIPGSGGPVLAVAAPVGAQGTLVVNTNQGTYAFEDAVTLIADGKRVLETKADGTVIWTLDSTVKYTTAGGELPIFDPAAGALGIANPPATGRAVEERKSISRPAVAKRLSQSDLLIADTGNNRVVRVDRGGRVLWELSKIRDPYGILATGDPLTLSEPSDVQFWLTNTYDNPAAPTQVAGYEAHYLVADPGNARLVEVVDYYDADGRVRDIPDIKGGTTRGQNVLVWTTRTASSEGRRLRYQSVERFFDTSGQPFVVAVVGNLRATGADASATSDFTGGALVNVVYKPFAVPFFPPGSGVPVVLWQPGPVPRDTEPPDNGLIAASIDDIVLANGSIKRITRPTYFQQITLATTGNSALPGTPISASPNTRRVYLLCDADGVFEVEPRNVNGRSVRYVTWSFTQQDYNEMNRTALPDQVPPLLPSYQDSALPRFIPTAVRRLPSGNFLITNSFNGRSPLFESGLFLGEVFEVEPQRDATTQIGQGGKWAEFRVPEVVGIPGRYRQQMGSSNNTNLLEQPLFADRLF